MKKALLSVLFIICATSILAQDIDSHWFKEHYNKQEVMIPMRDGVGLYTAIFTPKNLSPDNPRPILIQRTPYGTAPYGPEGFKVQTGFRKYCKYNYILVQQDVRGRFMSEGQFTNVEERPEDTWDTVDWLIKNIPDNNGKVGLTGSSYPGYYAMMGALCNHPAIKAAIPQAPVLDWFLGDDAHHNGVPMLLDTYYFGRGFYRPCPNPTTSMPPVINMVDKPVYDFFLDKFTIEEIGNTFPEPLPFWEQITEHPDYDEFWQKKSAVSLFKDIQPALLIVGGAFDTDDCFGALTTYRKIKELSPRTETYFLYGPWYHGTWRHTKEYYDKIEYQFLDHYLENGELNLAPVTVIPSSQSRGELPECVLCNNEKTVLALDSLPSSNSSKIKYFLNSGRKLSEASPKRQKKSERYSSYSNNPFNPVPFLEDPQSRDKRYMIADQRFAAERDDVLSFTSPVLEDTLKLVGPVDVDLFASCSGEDADFIVKIIDMTPDGYQMLVRWDVMRGRFRKGFYESVPMKPNTVEEIRFSLPDIAHYLMPGHQLMVQIQSTYFPILDLNPGKFVENIYKARREDFIATDISIYHSKKYPSSITFSSL